MCSPRLESCPCFRGERLCAAQRLLLGTIGYDIQLRDLPQSCKVAHWQRMLRALHLAQFGRLVGMITIRLPQ